jgi:two-component system phosphate regulon sensor histidine kinase PhoR
MAIDHRRLLSGLGAMSDQVFEVSGLTAVHQVLTAVQDATGVAGTAFVEYRGDAARVVLATAAMTWAVGRPVPPPNRLDRDEAPAKQAWPVRRLHPEVTRALLERGVTAFTGTPVYRDGQDVGAVALFFADGEVGDGPDGGWWRDGSWGDLELALRLAGRLVQGAYAESGPLRRADAADAEDRALFLAVAGHELRTPVTVVKGYANMLATRWDWIDEPDRREAARVLATRADDLARLVDRLLRASVGDGSGAWLVRTVPFNPAAALLQAVGELPAELRRPVRLRIPDLLPMALGDPRILSSVVAELVTNAVRATVPDGDPGPAGQASTQVDLEADADESTVSIRVSDRGTGIDPAEAAVAFERFWRSPRGGAARGGVGLGLYLVRRLVERQNGWVSLRPRDGGGTVAEVRLHRADGPTHRFVPGEV